MVLHVLKNDPALRELEHIQGYGLEQHICFFYDRHRCCGLMKEAALAIHSHLADGFSEWIEWSTHFKVVLLLLDEGCCHTAAAHKTGANSTSRPKINPTNQSMQPGLPALDPHCNW